MDQSQRPKTCEFTTTVAGPSISPTKSSIQDSTASSTSSSTHSSPISIQSHTSTSSTTSTQTHQTTAIVSSTPGASTHNPSLISYASAAPQGQLFQVSQTALDGYENLDQPTSIFSPTTVKSSTASSTCTSYGLSCRAGNSETDQIPEDELDSNVNVDFPITQSSSSGASPTFSNTKRDCHLSEERRFSNR